MFGTYTMESILPMSLTYSILTFVWFYGDVSVEFNALTVLA